GAHAAPKPIWPLDDIYHADEVFCTETMGELVCRRELFTHHSASYQVKRITGETVRLEKMHPTPCESKFSTLHAKVPMMIYNVRTEISLLNQNLYQSRSSGSSRPWPAVCRLCEPVAPKRIKETGAIPPSV